MCVHVLNVKLNKYDYIVHMWTQTYAWMQHAQTHTQIHAYAYTNDACKYTHITEYHCICMLKTRWHCANLFQPIKGFHVLRLYRIKWAIREDRCLYIGINVKARFSTQPQPQHTYATIYLVYPLIVTLLWCFNTVLYYDLVLFNILFCYAILFISNLSLM